MKGEKTMFTEILKLAFTLTACGIPYEISELFGGFHIQYPSAENCICSVICHNGSYGHEEGLLEIMGLLTLDELEQDNVAGWLTADDVAPRILDDYLDRKARG
jgi:hypothetical protein